MKVMTQRTRLRSGGHLVELFALVEHQTGSYKIGDYITEDESVLARRTPLMIALPARVIAENKTLPARHGRAARKWIIDGAKEVLAGAPRLGDP